MKITSRSTRSKVCSTVGVGTVALALTAALIGAPATASR